MSELLKSDDESMKFRVAMTVLNSAKNWRELRPLAPGHSRAEDEIAEEQVKALMQLQNWNQQFKAQGGKPDDFTMWLLQGGYQNNGNGADAVETTESKETKTSESDKTPD